MQMRVVLPLFAVAIAAGWILPDMFQTAPQATSADASGPKLTAQTAPDQMATVQDYADDAGSDDGWLSNEVTLDREPDGHFYADVDVNGQQVNFMVDTGATAIALTGADAEMLGFYWDYSELRVVGRGVSGDVLGKPVMLDNMQLGSLSVSNVPAAIIPDGLDRSLLGQAFLKKIDNVNISGDQMVLK